MMNSAIYIPVIFLTLAMVMAVIFFNLKRRIKVYTAVTHLLSFVFMFCVLGMTSVLAPHNTQIHHLILLISFFLLGTLHTGLMHRFQSWSRRSFFLAETLFTLLITFLGGAGYLFTFQLASGASSDWIMAGTILPFLLPFLIHKSFFLWKSIPDKIYFVWQYLEHINVPEATSGDTIILHFRMTKNSNSSSHSKFTVRAPLNMKVGDIFHYFLYNYNKQHPDHQLLVNSRSSPFGWYFYTQATWWKKRETINPNISVFRNQLKDDIIIHAKRIYLGY